VCSKKRLGRVMFFSPPGPGVVGCLRKVAGSSPEIVLTQYCVGHDPSTFKPEDRGQESRNPAQFSGEDPDRGLVRLRFELTLVALWQEGWPVRFPLHTLHEVGVVVTPQLVPFLAPDVT